MSAAQVSGTSDFFTPAHTGLAESPRRIPQRGLLESGRLASPHARTPLPSSTLPLVLPPSCLWPGLLETKNSLSGPDSKPLATRHFSFLHLHAAWFTPRMGTFFRMNQLIASCKQSRSCPEESPSMVTSPPPPRLAPANYPGHTGIPVGPSLGQRSPQQGARVGRAPPGGRVLPSLLPEFCIPHPPCISFWFRNHGTLVDSGSSLVRASKNH